MNLVGIEIDGFKSFYSKSKIKIDTNLLGIVGPNGSGKSNIVDAIRWVLGEQSAKNLRGTNMQDVIFSGSEKRSSKNYAKVSLIFLINNVKKIISRKLYRNGDSEYLVDNKRVRLKNITDIFLDLGINKESYSLITQGKVESIISSKSEDKRLIIEDVAGILKYKNKRKECSLKINKTEENLKRIKDIFNEIKENHGKLLIQKNRAEKFINYKKELKEKDIVINSLNIKKCEISLKKDVDDLNKYLKEKDNLLKQLDKVEKDISDTKEKLIKVDLSYQEKKEKEIFLIKEKEKINSIIKINNESKKNKKNLLKTVQENINVLVERKSNILIKIKNIKKEKEIFEEKYKKISEELALLDTDLENRINLVEKDIESLKSTFFTLSNEESKLQNEKNFAKKVEDNNNSRKINILSEIKNIKKDINVEKLEIDNIKKSINEINGEITALNILLKKSNKNKELLETLSVELEETNKKLKEKILKYENKKNFLFSQINNYSFYNQGVREIIKNKKNILGIIGIVADIFDFDKKYSIALDTALVSSQQNIIVEDEKVAKKCIEYLAKSNKGRATFLPINNIKKRIVNYDTLQNIKNEEGYINIASNLVKVDKKYYNIVHYLLSNVLIVDNLKNANIISKKINHKLKVITIDGQVINIGGSITGGATIKSNSIIKNKKNLQELTNNIYELNKNKLQLNKKIDENNNKIKELDISIFNIKKNLEKFNTEIIEKKLKVKLKEESLLSLNQFLNKNEERLKKINEENSKLFLENNIEKKLYQLDLEIKKINDDIENKIVEKNELTIQFKKNNKEINIMKINKNSLLEKINIKKELLFNFSSDINYIEEEIKNKKIEENNLLNYVSCDNNEDNKKLLLVNDKLLEISKEIDIIKQSKDSEYNKDIELSSEQKKIYSYINLASKKINNLEFKIKKNEKEFNDIVTYLFSNYNITIQNLENYSLDSNEISSYINDIKNLKLKINSLGNINLESIKEYEELNERYLFYKKQIEDLSVSKEKLLTTIVQIDKEVKERFYKTFTEVSSNFNRIYKMLFNGGNARLTLELGKDILETGVNIEASPPGKKLRNMSLLSGGEKALTAISLLFSILEIKNTPFVILDEVEAALDEENVNRFAKFLKLYSKNNQFLVITHRRGTMEVMEKLYGITMQEKGVSSLLSIDINDFFEEENINE